MSISYVICTYRDFDSFKETFFSVWPLLRSFDELVVVDSNESDIVRRFLEIFDKSKIVYDYLVPSGVYSAYNHGIKMSRCDWIQIIASGDILLEVPRSDIFISSDVIVGSQLAIFPGGEYQFVPQWHGTWPHQSMLVKRVVYDKLGGYDESFRITADQRFVCLIRGDSSTRVEFVSEPLTKYLGGGVSEKVNWSIAAEYYGLYRLQGSGIFRSLVKSYLKLILKLIVAFFPSPFRRFFTSVYKKIFYVTLQ